VDDLLAVINHWGPCEKGAGCDDPKAGDCYVAHSGGGCNEAACCEAICAFDPFCCDQQWDQICADFANIADACSKGVHPNCGNELAADCLSTLNPPIPGCNDSACCAAICQQDPFCCTYGWDSICVQMAQETCAGGPERWRHCEVRAAWQRRLNVNERGHVWIFMDKSSPRDTFSLLRTSPTAVEVQQRTMTLPERF
jgi:hypothetical protein